MVGGWWDNGGGFFGDPYIEADNSLSGFLAASASLEERTKREALGVVRLTGAKTGQRVLDCPCGYGRHSLALADLGLEVLGLDINEQMLAAGRNAIPGRSATHCVFERGDMRTLDYRDEFDLLINMFYSFGFFEDDENLGVLRNFYRALNPGGAFLMHTFVTPEKFARGTMVLHDVRELRSGRRLELSRSFNPANSREEGTWVLLDTSDREEKLTPYSMRIYTGEEWVAMCQGVGFGEVALHGDWDGAPYVAGVSPQMIAIARK